MGEEELWIKIDNISQDKFSRLCMDFYYDKTLERVNQFMKIKILRIL